MNRQDFIKAVAANAEMTQKDVKAVLEAAATVAYAEMANEGEVSVFEGLKLEGVKKEAHVARNPLTGGSVDVPEKIVPKAHFTAAAKKLVNGEE